jgi:cellulose synthase/poly-beta-1,6-N-acetylglucosamine synthase-like glycosyltransferase
LIIFSDLELESKAMIQAPPKVSIGLPVYNGERYLAETIQSLRDQVFPDFEIIICDNASTDGTAEICRRYLNLDKRIRYYRHSKILAPLLILTEPLNLPPENTSNGQLTMTCLHLIFC